MKRLPYKLIKESDYQLLEQKVKMLETQISAAKNFIREIEKGNLSTTLSVSDDASEADSLAVSLLSMRDQMKKISEEERQRNWITEGLAKFVDILRSRNDDLNALSDVIISNIVKYMGANQGSIFILNEDDPENISLELLGCYAYDRKKYLNRRIGLGEGMAGQAVLEKSTVYMTNIPGNYLKITSGLGEALPKNLLIVPLKLNEKVYGIIELASFNAFKTYQREFIERLAESIASTISAAKVNQQTRKLLTESQMQTEHMRSQEEEMRQNMEELSATQEEMHRVLKEVEGKEAYVSQLLNVSKDSIYTIDKNYNLVTWNKTFAATLERFGMRLEKGMNALDWYQGEERNQQVTCFDRALAGESFEITTTSDLNGSRFTFLSIYSPLRSDKGDVYEVAVFAKDITALVAAQKKAEQLANAAQQQTEELKAQEEELRQNMEELSSTQEEMHRVMKEVEAKEAYASMLLNVSHDLIYTIDEQYRLVSWNKAFADSLEKFGLKLEKGFNTLSWSPPKEQQRQIELYKRVFAGETFEFTAASEINGATYHFLSIYAPLCDEKGKVFEAAVYAKDVTTMVNAQQTAEQLKNEVQALLNASSDSIFTFDKEYKLLSFNKGFSTGLTEMGITIEKGYCVLDLFPDDRQKAEQQAHYRRAFAGERFDVTSEFNFNDTLSYYTSSFAPLVDERGGVFSVAVFGKNVTELVEARKKAEQMASESQHQTEELKAQEEELRQNMEELSATQEEMHRILKEAEGNEAYIKQLLNASHDMIFTIDKDYKLVSWNSAFATSLEAYGSQLEKGMNTLDWYPEASRAQQMELHNKVFAGETFEHVTESDVNGKTHFYVNVQVPLRNDKGEVFEIAIFAKDITETRNAEKEKQLVLEQVESRERFMQEVVNGCNHSIYVVDKNFKFISFNDTFTTVLQKRGIELKQGMDALSIIHNKKEREAVKKQLERVFAGESFNQTQEFSDNGIQNFAWLHYKPLRNTRGEIVGAGVYGEDITELMTIKKINEDLLQQVKNRN